MRVNAPEEKLGPTTNSVPDAKPHNVLLLLIQPPEAMEGHFFKRFHDREDTLSLQGLLESS